MTITSYDTLVTELEAFLIRTDLTARIPTFIQLFEGRMNRLLRTPEMEETATTSSSSNTIALPTDFLQARSLYIDSDPDLVLEAMSFPALRETYASAITSIPAAYAIRGQTIIIGPDPDQSYTYTLSYYQKIPALTDSNQTNWLIEAHPDAYLWGTLTMAEAYLQNDERFPVWKDAWDTCLAEIQEHANAQRLPATPLALRPTVWE